MNMISEAYTVYELHSDFLKAHSMSRWVIAAAQRFVDLVSQHPDYSTNFLRVHKEPDSALNHTS